MQGKLRLAMICGMILIFGASAFAVAKKRRGAEKEKDTAAQIEADKAAPGADKAAPGAEDPAVAGATKIDVKCNIPPIQVQVGPPARPPGTPAAAPVKPGATAKAPLFDWSKIGRDLLLTLIYSLLGLIIAMFGYFVYHWIVPFDLRKELEVDQNTSLGIVVGAIVLGLCIIVAAAIASPS